MCKFYEINKIVLASVTSRGGGYETLFLVLHRFSLALAGCRSPRFVNHSQPEFAVDFRVFENIRCSPDQYGFRRSVTNRPLADLGCNEIRKPSHLLGALDPSYPITLCLVIPFQNTEGSGAEKARMLPEGKNFFNIGGIVPSYVRYVIFRDNQFELIETEDKFRSVFTPIATPDEVLRYALAVRDLSAFYNQATDPKYQYFVDKIEDTFIEETAGVIWYACSSMKCLDAGHTSRML
jgi:hypothetical protein